MQPGKVLITGVNGFIGYAVTKHALLAGYRVIAAVRRQDAVETVLRGATAQTYHSSGSLTFAIIPDMTLKTAFIDAATNCTYIIHIANSLAGIPGRDLYRPRHRQHRGHSPCCGSNTASFEEVANPRHPRNVAVAEGRLDDVTSWTADTVCEEQPVEDINGPTFQWYGWGKAAARRVLREYATSLTNSASERDFSIVNLILGWTFRPDERSRDQVEATDPLGTNALLMHVFRDGEYAVNVGTGVPVGEDSPLGTCTLHLDDAADAHVKALGIPLGGDRLGEYILASDGPHGRSWTDAIEIAQANVPELRARINPEGQFSSMKVYFDASKTELELLGRPHNLYEKQVTDTLKWYSELPQGPTAHDETEK